MPSTSYTFPGEESILVRLNKFEIGTGVSLPDEFIRAVSSEFNDSHVELNYFTSKFASIVEALPTSTKQVIYGNIGQILGYLFKGNGDTFAKISQSVFEQKLVKNLSSETVELPELVPAGSDEPDVLIVISSDDHVVPEEEAQILSVHVGDDNNRIDTRDDEIFDDIDEADIEGINEFLIPALKDVTPEILEKLTVAHLKTFARRNDISLTGLTRKVDIVESISKAVEARNQSN